MNEVSFLKALANHPISHSSLNRPQSSYTEVLLAIIVFIIIPNTKERLLISIAMILLHSGRLRKGEVDDLMGGILTSDVGVLFQSINST